MSLIRFDLSENPDSPDRMVQGWISYNIRFRAIMPDFTDEEIAEIRSLADEQDPS